MQYVRLVHSQCARTLDLCSLPALSMGLLGLPVLVKCPSWRVCECINYRVPCEPSAERL
ncbi:hypothetical protein [Caudoviricetes sp.]|nr:hypothetical protein [Caudoviricetes sp.]